MRMAREQGNGSGAGKSSAPPTPRVPCAWSAVILAGGQSRRMGRDKAWLELEGKPLIGVAFDRIRELNPAEIFISGRSGVDYSTFKCPVLLDLMPGFGPLGGIERGLRESTSPLLLVLAVDLPRVTGSFLRRLLAHCDSYTGAVPALDRRLEPLVAVYPRRCHVLAGSALSKCQFGARDFAAACLKEHAVRTLPVSLAERGCFENWNQPSDIAGLPRHLIPSGIGS